jgi:hypothetical protein
MLIVPPVKTTATRGIGQLAVGWHPPARVGAHGGGRARARRLAPCQVRSAPRAAAIGSSALWIGGPTGDVRGSGRGD